MYLTKNRLSRSEMWCSTENHNYMRHICTKGFLDSNLNQAVINKISKFHHCRQIRIFTKIVIF